MKEVFKERHNNLYITTNLNCNLDCTYCYEQGRRKKTVFSVEKAKLLLDDFLNKDGLVKNTIINFHGGEPFLVFDKIKELCEWAWSKKFLHKYLFFATSNGTLIHGEIKNWLKANRDKFWVGLSLDGTKEMQDINRSNSFDKIDVAFFADTWESQSIKMTLSPQTLSKLFLGVSFLHSKFKLINCNLAELTAWDKEEYLKIFERELEKLTDFYINNPQIEPCSLLNFNLISVLNDQEIKKWCGAGKEMVVYDIDGRKYPCHLFLESFFGEDVAKKANEIDFENIQEHLDPNCVSCSIVRLCPTCYGANYLTCGNIATRNKDFCEFTKIRVKMACKLKAALIQKELANNDLGNFTEEKKIFFLRNLEAIDKLT